jgi:hypothetical protein
MTRNISCEILAPLRGANRSVIFPVVCATLRPPATFVRTLRVVGVDPTKFSLLAWPMGFGEALLRKEFDTSLIAT